MIKAEQARSWVTAGQQQGARYLLAKPSRAASGAAGLHLGLGRGASVEFQEHREYQPGDDLRWLDWNVSARSDRLIVKLYREEVSPCLDLLVDGSRSMALAGSDKAAATVALAALLATAATGAGWSHATWATGEVCERLGQAEIAAAWSGPQVFSAAANPGVALHRRPPAWRTRSVRVLISDLLWPGLPAPSLQRLVSGAAAATVLRLVSQQDLAAGETGNLRLVDVESEEELEVLLDSGTADRYQQAMMAHHQQWLDAARSYGVALTTIIAEDLLRTWDLSPLIEIGLLQAAP